jgi:dTDP-4-amino-4,6-dideoxygalactose transaminase
VPSFVDCDDSLNADVELVKQLLNVPTFHGARQPAAVLAVHNYGRRVDIDALHDAVATHARGAFVVEDLAEAHGVRPHPKTEAAAWSFYQNKQTAGEEGGACWFRDPARTTFARALRSQGYTGKPWMHLPRAVNCRMTNAQATLVLASLRMFEHNNEARWDIFDQYSLACPYEWQMYRPDAPWMFTLRVPGLAQAAQERAVSALQAAGIAARCCFRPMSWQEEFKNCTLVRGAAEHVAARLSREVIALPIQPGITDRDAVARAFEVLERALSPQTAVV